MTTVKKPSKTDKILVLVESPTKSGHISKILKKNGYTNTTVMASAGHICEIKDGGGYWNTGIVPEKDFETNYQIMPSKKDIVAKLRKAVKEAKYVYICSDEDFEGESIAYHLKNFLNIPESKYGRATFHEITEKAVLAGLDAPRKIDLNKTYTAKARQCLDKMEGFRISPVVQDYFSNRHASAGRCQSAGMLLITNREQEIIDFVPEKYFDLFLFFVKNKTKFKAKYWGKGKKEVKRISTIEEIEKIKKECSGNPYIVDSVQKKQTKESPKPPFITSTLQQEGNRILGMSVDGIMRCAQSLFENGFITYLRTDSTNMDPTFLKGMQLHIQRTYGKKYCGELQRGKISDSAQEAHECIRPTNISLTPEEFAKKSGDTGLNRVYRLIYIRTLQSTMTPAIYNDTQYNILNKEHKFILHSKELFFDGFKIVTADSDAKKEETEEEVVTESFVEKEKLEKTLLQEEAKETTPPSRFTEATFIKELDKCGIGRPSTYATIVKTILSESRGYCVLDKKSIKPTENGMKLSRFLSESFPSLINIKFTKEMEDSLDKIASGSIDYLSFLKEFYTVLEDSASKITVACSKSCPNCGKPLVKRRGKFGPFYGCSGWKSDGTGCSYVERV